MQLYFIRHGIAEDRGTDKPDAERELTSKGIAHMRDAAQVMKALGLKPDPLYSSPLVRARQTADLLAEALGVTVQERKELAPGFNIHAVETLTRDLGEDAEVMFVGHEPDFSTTISSLVGGRVVMKKGGLARIEVVSRQPLLGDLLWLIAPKIFEQMNA